MEKITEVYVFGPRKVAKMGPKRIIIVPKNLRKKLEGKIVNVIVRVIK